MLKGRANKGPELHQPNTIDGCADGTSGTYENDESLESIKVISTTGTGFAGGSPISIEAVVYAWSTGSSDWADFYHAADASNPVWQYITTVPANSGGEHTLTASYVLPLVGMMQQAVRVKFRYSGDKVETGCGPNSGYDDIDDLAFAVDATATFPPTTSPGPLLVAVYSSTYQAPLCSLVGTGCDTDALVEGRGSMNDGAEPNTPNSIYNSCQDGNSGNYKVDESIERIRVFTSSGGALNENSLVTVEATVYAWNDGKSDRALFYYASDAESPVWMHIDTVTPSGGQQVVSVEYTLPAGSLQAVRVAFRYNNEVSSNSCVSDNWNDVDDVVFAVGSSTSSSYGTSSVPVLEDEVPTCGEKDEPAPGKDCMNCCSRKCDRGGMLCKEGRTRIFSD